jgi:Rrf2 family nitric oxide-sensitive transcriptional repressor
MHITKYTDYSLRTLMLLALQEADHRLSITEISETLRVSNNHLMKVVNNLARLGLVDSMRGRGGGIRLVPRTRQMTIGAAIRQLEPVEPLVDCDSGPCLFRGRCELDLALRRATQAFLDELDKQALSDLVGVKVVVA